MSQKTMFQWNAFTATRGSSTAPRNRRPSVFQRFEHHKHDSSHLHCAAGGDRKLTRAYFKTSAHKTKTICSLSKTDVSIVTIEPYLVRNLVEKCSHSSNSRGPTGSVRVAGRGLRVGREQPRVISASRNAALGPGVWGPWVFIAPCRLLLDFTYGA